MAARTCVKCANAQDRISRRRTFKGVGCAEGWVRQPKQKKDRREAILSTVHYRDIVFEVHLYAARLKYAVWRAANSVRYRSTFRSA